ncbi:MAG: D-tyrosyl-tRNA(Tyr) deacylase [Flavobacteriales bacterium]|nr:MAG: D-tyrosyl-tRNA(Tyr) deacylase [Bacteroidota bacterium]KXK35014.1 MAG: D-Tyr-tRNATyr deacylase [Chlorobi bacterium OLB6]MBE2265775.1 D-tyrosyl-tRNA(Tyr) deacylase [Flavobacteriales bacterium]MBV6464053.1 D-aminoacyl-tRNA deacylase [Chlorobiota bacterium]MBW7853744.1 D-tyrosyl-tRNA(Tyr) deacylase [Candidatus Kapabacteria bacterium]MCC6331536.1 D-tyrosyl-tRNA(Tyr) deacylase [Ignavibacteria bacterium]
MRCIVQRVVQAGVTIEGSQIASIGKGLLVLAGITHTDTVTEAEWMAEKLVSLRVFADDEGRMNRSILDTGGEILLVSQFTLYGTLKKGTRPSFTQAAAPEHALIMFTSLVEGVKTKAPYLPVSTGMFGAMMEVSLINDGPVTIILER